MDPATVFLLYVIGALCLWILGTTAQPAIEAFSRLAITLPVGRRVAAVAISAVLVGSVGAARASVEPPTSRMVQMAEDTSPISNTAMSIAQRSMMTTGATYTVVSGDSLWRISRALLSEVGSVPDGSGISDLWRAIYDANRELIGANPNLIHPGQVLRIPGR